MQLLTATEIAIYTPLQPLRRFTTGVRLSSGFLNSGFLSSVQMNSVLESTCSPE